MTSPLEQRKAVRQAIENVQEQINSLESLITAFDADDAALQSKLSAYVASLKDLHTAGSALHRAGGAPYEVPVELLRYVDDGGNPDSFIVEVIRSAAAANEAARGKVVAFEKLRQGVGEDVARDFPETSAAYTSLRTCGGGGGDGAAAAGGSGGS